MKSIKEIAERLSRAPGDVVGVHLDARATRVVRMRRQNDEVSLAAAAILPPVELMQTGLDSADSSVRPLALPTRLRAPYACLAVSGETAFVKLLSFSGAFDERAVQKIPTSMGIKDASEYRIANKVVTAGHGRTESRVLAVAMPTAHVHSVADLLPSGTPAPYSIEVACLAALTAFASFLQHKGIHDAVGVIDVGASASAFGLFKDGIPLLFRLFEFGTNTIVDTVKEMLKVDRETAEGIIADGAFDVSQPVRRAMAPLTKQLIVSRDFVERREKCSVTNIYAGGHLAVWDTLLKDLYAALDVQAQTWDPFTGIQIGPDAIPENLVGEKSEFAAAVGACLPALTEEP